MAFGVLEPSTESHVAGTVILEEVPAPNSSQSRKLKHSSEKDKSVILAPQPSEDPNDPLNWTSFEKHLILGILCFGSIINASALGPLLTAGTIQISVELGVPVQKIALLTGYFLLSTGSAGPFVSALARKYGKRPLYIFSSVMAVIGCIIGEIAVNYQTLLAARIVQGFAATSYEALIVASIGDLFFVHQRGSRVALVMFILTSIANGISIVAGTITANLGWTYNFHILLPFVAAQLILLILFVPETTYQRKVVDANGPSVVGDSKGLDAAVNGTKSGPLQSRHLEDIDAIELNQTTNTNMPTHRKPWPKRMSPYNGTFVQDSIFKMLIACLAILFNLGALYNVVVSGTFITWSVGTSIISSILWTAPPYSLTAAGVGYMSVGPLIGGVVGATFYGIVADPIIKKLARKNGGVYEPEFRLPIIILGLIPTVAGLVGFGYSCQNFASVYVISFTWGVMLCGLFLVASVTTAYALDAFREHSTEIFIMNMMFKNFFFYGLSEYIIEWLLVQGIARMCNVMAGISVGICLTTVPLYIYGKRYRLYWQRHNLIKKWRLEMDKSGSDE